MYSSAPKRVHVVVGSPWKDAVISLLDSRSPYTPWPDVPDSRRRDGVVVVFDSEPRLALLQVGRVRADGKAAAAIAGMRTFRSAVPASLVGLDGLDARHTLVDGPAATQLLSALEDHTFDVDPMDRFGHSSMASARVLLDCDGMCDGCGAALRLRRDDARDAVEVWTVESLRYRPEPVETQPDSDWWFEETYPSHVPVDWPAALCPKCQRAMDKGGFRTFLDYKFSRHPACPSCGGQQTQRALFGMLPFDAGVAPWRDPRGCCVTEDNWTCTLCAHQW
jgi:hypothetical protein